MTTVLWLRYNDDDDNDDDGDEDDDHHRLHHHHHHHHNHHHFYHLDGNNVELVTNYCPKPIAAKSFFFYSKASSRSLWSDIKSVKWRRHQMETFSALMALYAGNSPVTGEFPTQRPVTRSFDVFFDLCPNERLSKQSWGWWFGTLSSPLWRHRKEK